MNNVTPEKFILRAFVAMAQTASCPANPPEIYKDCLEHKTSSHPHPDKASYTELDSGNEKVETPDIFVNVAHLAQVQMKTRDLSTVKLEETGALLSCGQCEYETPAEEDLKTHRDLIHMEFSYQCDECPYQFTEKDHLKEHKQNHHNKTNVRNNQSNLKFSCISCDYSTPYKSNLKKHIELVHTAISNDKKYRYKCDECGYQATQKGHLKAHKASQHEGIRYPCTQCDYQATEKGHLTKHIESVHDKIKYDCPHCAYQSTNKSNLRTHIKSIHEGKRYPCQICGHQATRSSHLRTHMRKLHGIMVGQREEMPSVRPRSWHTANMVGRQLLGNNIM